MNEGTITRNAAIERYNISKPKLFALVGEGKIEATKSGAGRTASWLINEEQLKQYATARDNKEKTPAQRSDGRLTIQEASDKYGLHAATIRLWILDGTLDAELTKLETGHTGYLVAPAAIETTMKHRRKVGRPLGGVNKDKIAASPKYLTVKEAEKLTGLGSDTLMRRANKGEIPSQRIKVGNRTRVLFDRTAVENTKRLRPATRISGEKTGYRPTFTPPLPEITTTANLNKQLQTIAEMVQDGLFEVEQLEVRLKFSGGGSGI